MKDFRKKVNYLYKQELIQILENWNWREKDRFERQLILFDLTTILFIQAAQRLEDKLNQRPKVNQTECIVFRNQFVDAFAEEAKVK